MVSEITNYKAKRLKLAEIARREGLLQLEGDINNSGSRIEKYLSLFRKTLNQKLGTDYYTDLNTGFDWCGAFVYYCCIEAGFHFTPQPSDQLSCSLALVSSWVEWASLPKNDFKLNPLSVPEPGDLVVFNKIISVLPSDHIGVLLENNETHFLVAEGNVNNRSGIFRRNKSKNINCLIRINKY